MSSHDEATKTDERSLGKDERGAIVLMGVFMSAFLVGGLWYLMGIGDAIVYRETVQTGVDSTAFTAAVYHARGMNVIAMVNIVIGAVLAILAASTVLLQMAALILSLANTLCDMFLNPGTDAQGNPLSYPHLQFSCEVIDEAEDLMNKMTWVVGQVKANTGDMLASLSTAQREVARTAPWLGSSQSNGVALMHAPYVLSGGSGSVSMVPSGDRFGLPVQDDPFQEACDRGNSIVGKLAQLLIPAELNPIIQMLDWGEADKLPAEVCMGKPGSGDPDDLFNEDDVCDDVVGNGQGNNGNGNGNGGSGDDDDDDDDDEKACEDDYKKKKDKHKNGGGESLFDAFDPNNKSTKGIYGTVRNGDDFFQVYSVVTGDVSKIERSNKGVEAPTWGSGAVESVGADSDEGIAVAQAEFYYDQTRTAISEDGCYRTCPAGLNWESYRENVLWNLRWRARLRRYRMPQNVEFNVLTQVIPAIDIEFQSGLGPYNSSVNKGPALFNSTAVADKTGEGAFIGGGTYIIH